MKPKKILILGSTGSIGTQTLDIIREYPKYFQITGLSVFQNISLLQKQVDEFCVPEVCVIDPQKSDEYIRSNTRQKVFSGKNGVLKMIQESDSDLVLLAMVGEDAIKPAKEVLRQKKHLALATKEVIVSAGNEIVNMAKENDVLILPIDSEHSAIWQALSCGKKSEIKKIWLTCSGGPFRDKKKWTQKRLQSVTLADALIHPNWDMGRKISIDSATLMNKALELIEIVRLFQVPQGKVEVVIHPESYLHSAVEFVDGSIIGQIGTHDMRTPIAYALFYPDRAPLSFPKFSFFNKNFSFEEVDSNRFPSLLFAREALRRNLCKELNHENEKAVKDFMEGKIGFLDIFSRVEKIFSC